MSNKRCEARKDNYVRCIFDDDHIEGHSFEAPVGPLASGPRERTPDEMCEHVMAMDVHCCGCHSGFLFDGIRCTCAGRRDGDLTQLVKARAEALSALDAKLGTTYAVIERDALLLADIVSTVRATCIVNLGLPDYPSSHKALRTILKIVGAGNGRQS